MPHDLKPLLLSICRRRKSCLCRARVCTAFYAHTPRSDFSKLLAPSGQFPSKISRSSPVVAPSLAWAGRAERCAASKRPRAPVASRNSPRFPRPPSRPPCPRRSPPRRPSQTSTRLSKEGPAMNEMMSPVEGEQVVGAGDTDAAKPDPIGATKHTLLTTMPIADIKVGTRHRKDIGDIAALAASIADVGLLHPIVVKQDGTLIAGERRLLGFKQLSRTEIPVTVVDIDEIARGELAENFHRKDFTITEALAIAEALAVVEKEAAKARQVEGGRSGGKGSGKLPEASRGDSRDKIADVTGYSATTLRNAKAVVDAAEAEPEKFGHLVKEMDETGKVDRAHKQLRKKDESQRQTPRKPKAAASGTEHLKVQDGEPTLFDDLSPSLAPAASPAEKRDAAPPKPAEAPQPLEHFSIRLGVARVCEISFAFFFGNPFEKRGDCSPKLLNSARLHFA